VHFDRERLPTIEVHGKVIRSTAGCLHELLRAHAPAVTLPACYDALVASWQEAERRRAIDHREVAALERFEDFFARLALSPAPAVAQALIDAHRTALAAAARFPAHHGPLLRRLARRHRLAVVSNFDYSPTALAILEAAGVRDLFAAIVVSDQVGWRKPRPDIFHHALKAAGVEAAQTLFVGDKAELDVAGAHRVGMHAAWINPGRELLPAGIAPPQFEIRDLAELEAILAA
jgi:HAD superfamily hydrolase (TIGR01509 family)